jgi:Protein of unknown function (DUF2950)
MNTTHTLRATRLRIAAILFGLVIGAGCAQQSADDETFKTPEEAVGALVTALQKDDVAGLQALLGPGSEELLNSGDAVQDASDRAAFVAAYEFKHALIDDGPDRKILVTGQDDWPMPIPIVKRAGGWLFDGEAGIDEIIYRRVGGNELGAIDVCRGFVNAQLEYASEGRDGDPAGIYALKLVSDEGLHNGLYWPTEEGEPPSPAGPFVAAAAAEGYRRAEGDERAPYHGYYYRMLYAQGENANGGARDYFKDGLLTEGFALIAWPADYGSSGVQTFIVNQDGVVFQKDLGEDTATAVEAIQSFDPDSSWTAIVPPEEPAA